MSSRDFGFLTLRNIQAYQSNGNPVPPNQVLVTSGAGSGGFTNSLIISTICVSTVEVSTIFIDREIASSINTNTINTNFLTVNSTTNLSTTIINNTLSLVGNTPADSEIWLHNYKSRLGTSDPYGGLYLEASTTTSIWFSNLDATAGPYAQIGKNFSAFYGSVNVASTLVASTLDARYISSYTIDVQSTLRFFDGPSTVILDAQGSTLYVNGFPILSGGSISSVSSLFWLPRNPTDGSIYNENIGTAPNYYQIGLGTNGNQLNALVDIANNTYTGTKNVFNISSFNNRFVIDNINSSIQNYMTARFIDNQNNPFAIALKFEKTINFQSTTSNCELGYIDFYGTNTSQSTVRGAYILARQQNLASTFAPTDLQFLTCTSSTETINMVITSQGNVGIGTTTPESTLTVFGSCYISSGLTIDGGGAGGGGTTYGSLKIQGGIDENSILIQDGTSVTPNTGIYNGYFIGNSINFGGASTFQIGRVDGVAEPNKAIYMTQAGNVGINTFTPQFTFDVDGSINAQTFLSTNTINMGAINSAINFSSILNINSYLAAQDNGVINIGTAYNPVIYMGSDGTTRTHIINGNISTSASLTVNSYVSTNTINMNSGYINSAGNLKVSGPLLVSSSTDGNANLGLFNNKASFTTNPTFDGCYLELNNSGPQFVVSGPGASPNYAIIASTVSQFNQTRNNGPSVLRIQNSGTTATSAELQLTTYNGSFSLYASQSEASSGGLIPSTFQIYSYYPTPTPVLTIYPNGNMNIPGNLTVSGSALSNVVCSTINNNSPTWSDFYGKYCFVTNNNASLTIGTPSTDGTIIVFRNNTPGNTTITVNGNTIASGKTLSFVYTATTGSTAWFTL